jgi:hypothetical protein
MPEILKMIRPHVHLVMAIIERIYAKDYAESRRNLECAMEHIYDKITYVRVQQ